MTSETTQQFAAYYVRELLAGTKGIAAAIEDLDDAQLHFRAHDTANSVGFDAWHVFRTADNIVHFAFYREQPVWLAQGLDATWGLPRNSQGTGMDPAEAHALRFPSAVLLGRYGRDVADAICPRIEAMADDFLAEITSIQPQGELTRLLALGTTILTHGYVHLGQINLARTLLGRQSLDF